MATIAEQIKEIEEEILKTQKNKATEFHIGKLKAKIAKLRQEQEKQRLMGGGGGGKSFAVKKSGNATVGLVGLPSVGKSTLMNKLTGTESEVGAYAFTTLDVIPGSMEYKGANIQILDMPGIIKGAASGKGRGKEVLAAARSSDLIFITVNAYSPNELEVVLREIYDAGIRLNQKPADIQIVKSDRGGLKINKTVELTNMDDDYIEDICREFKVVNANIVIREDITIDQLIDKLAGNRVYTRGFIALTKSDLLPEEDLQENVKELSAQGFRVVPISAITGMNMDLLKDTAFEILDFIRVYLRPHKGETDYEEPLVITRGSTVGDVCDHLHREFRKLFRYAQVWGKSAKFDGQHVSLDHVLEDQDVLTIVTKKKI
ncbi:MAG: GTP-binding protein [Euryarchaeota archaeon]|nr:GTP-binding protein [Euryarchaeota archaeon]